MNILITGGAGFIGSRSRPTRLLAEGQTVLVIDNYSTGRRDNLCPHERLTVVEGTIADSALVDRIFDDFKPEIVVHAAASYKDPGCLVRRRHDERRGNGQRREGLQALEDRPAHLFPDIALLRTPPPGAAHHADASLLLRRLCRRQQLRRQQDRRRAIHRTGGLRVPLLPAGQRRPAP